MDTKNDYFVAKSIVQSGLSQDEWDILRNSKGEWPIEHITWRQY